jgi:hypothetical protein
MGRASLGSSCSVEQVVLDRDKLVREIWRKGLPSFTDLYKAGMTVHGCIIGWLCCMYGCYLIS